MNNVMWMSHSQFEDLRMAHDPYGIYRSRKMLAKVLPGIAVFRGREWWHG